MMMMMMMMMMIYDDDDVYNIIELQHNSRRLSMGNEWLKIEGFLSLYCLDWIIYSQNLLQILTRLQKTM